MKPITDEELEQLPGEAGNCVTSIAISASVGGLFGGVGAIVGAAVAASGPACLGWW